MLLRSRRVFCVMWTMVREPQGAPRRATACASMHGSRVRIASPDAFVGTLQRADAITPGCVLAHSSGKCAPTSLPGEEQPPVPAREAPCSVSNPVPCHAVQCSASGKASVLVPIPPALPRARKTRSWLVAVSKVGRSLARLAHKACCAGYPLTQE